MSEAEKFPSKKLFQYIQREETSLAALKGFFKATAEGEAKGLDSIRQLTKEMGIALKKIENRQITKLVTHFSCHLLQGQQIPEIIDLIQNKLKVWMEQISQRYKIVKERVRSMQIRKNNLTQQQINQFKEEITKEFTWITQRKNSVVKLFCYTKVKHSSRQIESITSVLQNDFLAGKSKMLKNK